MSNILIIFNRLNENFVKQRVLVLVLVVQNIILSLITLIYANVIIANGRIYGELDYSQVKFFYNMVIAILFGIICLYVPLLFSRELNNMYVNNTIDHLLAVKIEISDVIYAIFLRGLFTLIILLVSSFPVISIAFYFGGFGISKIIRLLLFVISFASLISSICMYISTKIFDPNISMIVSYVVSIGFSILNIYYLNKIIITNISVTFYILISFVLILIFVTSARNTKLYNT